MIAASELRIGNYFHYWPAFEGDKKTTDVVIGTGSNPKKFHKRVKGKKSGWNQETQCHPIELTPEILKKAGFKQIDYGTNPQKAYILNNIVIHFNGFYYSYDIGKEMVVREIKHLHQLQNLYFSLSGKELEINL